MAVLVEFKCSANRRKWKLVRLFKIVAQTAMPMAPPQVAHHVEQSARVFEPVRWQTAQTEMHGWSYRKHLRETTQDLRQKKLCATPVVCDEAEDQQGKTKERQT